VNFSSFGMLYQEKSGIPGSFVATSFWKMVLPYLCLLSNYVIA
jgi:hypothetical protein